VPYNREPGDEQLAYVKVRVRFFVQVSGVLRNTGQTVVFTIEKGSPRVNISGGPLAYRYQFEELYIHYGPEDIVGSEHVIQGLSYPAEVSKAKTKAR